MENFFHTKELHLNEEIDSLRIRNDLLELNSDKEIEDEKLFQSHEKLAEDYERLKAEIMNEKIKLTNLERQNEQLKTFSIS